MLTTEAEKNDKRAALDLGTELSLHLGQTDSHSSFWKQRIYSLDLCEMGARSGDFLTCWFSLSLVCSFLFS